MWKDITDSINKLKIMNDLTMTLKEQLEAVYEYDTQQETFAESL